MIGTVVNTAAVIGGGIKGLLLKKRMPERVTTIYFQAIGLFTLAIGISMAVQMKEILIVVSSLAIGSLSGEWMNLESGGERMSAYLKKKFRVGGENFSEGLITAFLLFCVGSMTIVGVIQEGTGGSPDLLFTKSLMDFFFIHSFGFGIRCWCSIFGFALFCFSRFAHDVGNVCRFVSYRRYNIRFDKRWRYSVDWFGY